MAEVKIMQFLLKSKARYVGFLFVKFDDEIHRILSLRVHVNGRISTSDPVAD